jgi:hypothetical protein
LSRANGEPNVRQRGHDRALCPAPHRQAGQADSLIVLGNKPALGNK